MMARETARKCSHCGNNGHNSRTCSGKGCFKLFGVQLLNKKIDPSFKESASFGNLQFLSGNSNGDVDYNGYLSDGLVHFRRAKTANERKKGKPWNEVEHLNFLAGLKLLGKGDWKGISKKFVRTRTPSQVASHAQKYFLRQALSDKKNRRASVFDIGCSEPANNLGQAANQFPDISLNEATIAIPHFSTPCHDQNFGGFWALNYQRAGCVYMPPCAPVTTHHRLSGIPPPSYSFLEASRSFKTASTTSTAKYSLELKIGPPEPSRRTDLSSPASEAIRVI